MSIDAVDYYLFIEIVNITNNTYRNAGAPNSCGGMSKTLICIPKGEKRSSCVFLMYSKISPESSGFETTNISTLVNWCTL